MSQHSVAHKHDMNWIGKEHYPDGLVPWTDAVVPDLEAEPARTSGRLRSCGYCGSMHPADVAAAIRAGARGSWADFKYGWPHKAYFDGVPNPHAGMLESRSSTSHPRQEEIDAGKWVRLWTGRYDPSTGEKELHWYEAGKPAQPTTYAQFYSVHLQDASPEDREIIEQHLGMRFEFTTDGAVRWQRCP